MRWELRNAERVLKTKGKVDKNVINLSELNDFDFGKIIAMHKRRQLRKNGRSYFDYPGRRSFLIDFSDQLNRTSSFSVKCATIKLDDEIISGAIFLEKERAQDLIQ